MKKSRSILMVASSSDDSQSRPTRATRSKAGLFSQTKNDLFMFINRFKNESSDYISSSRNQNNLLHKQTILNWLRNKLYFDGNDCYLFYSGKGRQNGDWLVETVENPEGELISLTSILEIWEHYGKGNIYMFFSFSSLINYDQKISSQFNTKRNAYVLSFHELNKQTNNNKDSGLFKCILQDNKSCLQNYELLRAKINKKQIQIFLSHQSRSMKLNEEQMRLLCADILNISTLVEQMKKVSAISKEDLEKIIDQIYEKTDKIWKFQEKEENVKELSIKHINQIKLAAQQSNPKALFLLGRAYERGYGVDVNSNQSVYWYLKAKDKKEKNSCYGLYINQDNEQKELKLLQQGQKLGSIRCIRKMGIHYLKSKTLPKKTKYAKLMGCIKQLFSLNSNYGHELSFFCYRDKEGTFYDEEKAQYHFNQFYKTANIKNMQKQMFLGQLLIQADCQSDAVGPLISYYENHDFPKKLKGKVQSSIGQCFEGMEKSEQAKFWFEKAVQNRDIMASVGLSFIYDQQGKQQLVQQLLHKATKFEDQNNDSLEVVFLNLGSSYYNSGDFTKAYQYYYESAKLGNNLGRLQCERMLEKGEGVNKDKRKSKSMKLKKQ